MSDSRPQSSARGRKKKRGLSLNRRAEKQAKADVVAATFANTDLVSAKEALESYYAQFTRAEEDNRQLRAELEQQQQDSLTVIEHLEQRLDELNTEYGEYQEQVAVVLRTHEEAQRKLETQYQASVHERDEQIASLLSMVGRLQEDLRHASRYVQQRQEHTMELKALQDRLDDLATTHEKELTALRFQTIDRKMKLVALERKMLEEYHESSDREAQRLLELKHRNLVESNHELLKEKATLLQDINGMLTLTRDIDAERTALRRKADLHLRSQREVMRRAAARAQQTREQADKAMALEARVRELTAQQKDAVAAVRAELEGRVRELEAQLASANAAVGAHRKELQQMRALASHVVSQRTDLEKFFYVALEDCKRYRAALGPTRTAGPPAASASPSSSRVLPPVGNANSVSATSSTFLTQTAPLGGSVGGGSNSSGRGRGRGRQAHQQQQQHPQSSSSATYPSPSSPSPPPSEGAYVEEMSWEDKEKVIKALLFYINSTYYKSSS